VPGARSVVSKPTAVAKPKRKVYKRPGSPSDAEKGLVADVVANSPGGLSPTQQNALATVLKRGRGVVKQMVEDAAMTLAERAGRYADIHLQTTEAALANGDAKSLEVAARASQWAMENINVDGTGVVEKPASKPTGPSVMIGIKLGGMQTPSDVIIEGAKVESEKPLE
jgi:hypothetical protein